MTDPKIATFTVRVSYENDADLREVRENILDVRNVRTVTYEECLTRNERLFQDPQSEDELFYNSSY